LLFVPSLRLLCNFFKGFPNQVFIIYNVLINHASFVVSVFAVMFRSYFWSGVADNQKKHVQKRQGSGPFRPADSMLSVSWSPPPRARNRVFDSQSDRIKWVRGSFCRKFKRRCHSDAPEHLAWLCIPRRLDLNYKWKVKNRKTL
jgi:hypothetical protein